MTEPTTIHLITHNHWDREWIFTARYANRWLPKFFTNLLAKLDAEPDYRFVLDGQTLIIEDYLNQLTPDEAAARQREIRRFAQRGQLQVGPAYLQPDWSLVSGEALVRNLLIGDRMAREYGPVMKAGWLLDNFGQIAQAPQILRGFGIEGAFVWRGVDFPPEILRTEFWWEAPDGSRIMGVYLLDSYRNAMTLSMAPEIAQARIRSHAGTLRRFATSPNVLLMNGYEQVPEPDDVLPLIARFNEAMAPEWRAVQSTPPEYLAAVQSHDPDLPVLRGYFYSGRFAPILKGVYSSRSYLNQQNNECQRELERWAEKFNSFAWAYGFDYPEDRFEQAWKTLLLNHTHDDMCGCCIDPIAQDMQVRFAEVNRMARVLSSESLRALVQSVDTARVPDAQSSVVLFNPSSHPRRDVMGISMELDEDLADFHIRDGAGNVIPFQLVSRIGNKADFYLWTTETLPGVGYRTYYVLPGKGDAAAHPQVRVSAQEHSMENDYLHVTINPNGSLTIREKIHNHLYENLGYFEDGGDAGDTYDYAHPAQDRIITSLEQRAVISLEQAGPLLARFRVELTLELPRRLSTDRQRRSDKSRPVRITSFVELAANVGHVEITTVVQNVVKDHRLRVIFPTGIETERSFAGMPYDVASFPLVEAVENDVPAHMRDLMLAGRYTAPVNTRPFQNFIALADDESSLSVFSRGLSEYEILPEQRNAIALTLLRGVGWLTRSDLLTREGDVGPHIFTPEAQALGTQTFEYAIYPHGGNLAAANPHFEADRHVLKFRGVQTNAHPGQLPDSLSFFHWREQEVFGALKLTAVKQSEDGRDLIVRFYNALDRPVSASFALSSPILGAWRTNLNEEDEATLAVVEGAVPVQARGKEIVTVRVQLAQNRVIDDFVRRRARVLPPLVPDSLTAAQNAAAEMPPLVTQAEVDEEQRRADQLAAALQAIRSEAFILQTDMERRATPSIDQQALLQRLKGREATLSRQHYEAQISALLNRQLLATRHMETQLDQIGESLNWARVRKRVGEFLIHYYEGQREA